MTYLNRWGLITGALLLASLSWIVWVWWSFLSLAKDLLDAAGR